MNTCSDNFRLDSEWQATSIGFATNLRNAILAIPENSTKIYIQVPKPLTRAAVYMISVILIFVLLAVAGSAITVNECLRESRALKRKKHGNYSENIRKSFKYKEKKSEISNAFLNGIKSFLSCFCFLKNGKNLFRTSSNSDQFKCIHGIRVINTVIVIYSHFFGFYMFSIRNAEELKHFFGTWLAPFALNTNYAVDVFFVLSGFLNAYSFFNNYDKSNGNVSWHYFYLKRLIRITPVYMIVFGFYTFLFPYMGSGPLWPTFDTNPVCRKNWLWNLLYINNFIDYTEQCMEWCWYLAADMQFYISSPIFLILLKRLWIYFDLMHIKPYTRISSYLVGILLAHYFHKNNINMIKCSKITLFIGWIITCTLWFIVYFALFKPEESITENAVYNGIENLFFSIGLSWIIFACLTGEKNLLGRSLSWKIFSPLAKLSYCAYLIHPIIIMRYYQTAKTFEDLVFLICSCCLLTSYFGSTLLASQRLCYLKFLFSTYLT